MVVNSLWETSPFFFGGGGMSQSPNNLLEIVASICQGCFSESALVRPKKFGESNFTPKSPTPHLRAIRTNLWSMATSLGMKAMQSPLRSMARSKNVESSSNLSKLDANIDSTKRGGTCLLKLVAARWLLLLFLFQGKVGAGKINIGNIQIHRSCKKVICIHAIVLSLICSSCHLKFWN